MIYNKMQIKYNIIFTFILFISFIIPINNVKADVTANVNAYFKLDQADNTTYNNEILNNIGLRVNNAQNANVTFSSNTAKLVNSAYFNGTSSILTPNSTNFDTLNSTTASINLWINHNQTATSGTLVCKGQATTPFGTVCLTLDGESKKIVSTRYNNTGTAFNATSTTALNSNEWYMVTMTTSGASTPTKIKTYINGTLETTQTGFTGVPATVGTWLIGNKFGSSLYYKGYMDEIGTWNRTLDDKEILELYNSGTGFTYPFINSATSTGTSTSGLTATDMETINLIMEIILTIIIIGSMIWLIKQFTN